MTTEEDVRRIALSLPETTYDSDTFHCKVRDKSFAWPYMERIHPKKPRVRRLDVFAIRIADEWDKQALLTLDPAKFFTDAHYNGFPAVLVRLAAIDVDELEELLVNAWRLKAPRKVVADFDKHHESRT